MPAPVAAKSSKSTKSTIAHNYLDRFLTGSAVTTESDVTGYYKDDEGTTYFLASSASLATFAAARAVLIQLAQFGSRPIIRSAAFTALTTDA